MDTLEASENTNESVSEPKSSRTLSDSSKSEESYGLDARATDDQNQEAMNMASDDDDLYDGLDEVRHNDSNHLETNTRQTEGVSEAETAADLSQQDHSAKQETSSSRSSVSSLSSTRSHELSESKPNGNIGSLSKEGEALAGVNIVEQPSDTGAINQVSTQSPEPSTHNDDISNELAEDKPSALDPANPLDTDEEDIADAAPADGSPSRTRQLRRNPQPNAPKGLPISTTTTTITTQEQRRAGGIPRQFSYVSNNRERLRYSWQAVQDEEPNRPRIHIVKLVSNTTSASAGFPGGEALQFTISPGGRRIAAYNSARLYILQTAALPVGISQDYALKRRPVSVEVIDDGNTVAILVDPHTVNIYDLGDQELERVKTITLDFATHCVALSRTGGLLAAAYEGGIEIFSLASNALPTDRRAVRSQRIDRMAFSEDSSTLLGTTTRINASSTVVVSVPVFPSAADGIPTHEELKEAWCSELLQPENIRNSSHATYMRESRSMSNDRLFAWNGLADTFGLLNLSDLQYGNVDFPVVISPPLSTCGGLGAAIHSCPAIDENGKTVAMIVNDRTVRLYIVPTAEIEDDTIEAHSIDHELDEWYGNPFTEVRWVHSNAALPAPLSEETPTQGRLIVASPGGVLEANTSLGLGLTEDSIDDIEGGRIIVFDFDPQFAGQEGQTFSLTLGSAKPQLLEEAQFDAAEEVALVRRRTVNQRKGGDLIHRPVVLGRSATTFGNRSRRGRGNLSQAHDRGQDAARFLPDLVEDSETLDAFEQPYQQTAPRSQASLQRSATNVQRHRFQILEERSRERIPNDSTGDAFPLPEYTEEPNAPLPSRYRALAGLDQPAPPAMNVKDETSSSSERANPAAVGDTQHDRASNERLRAMERNLLAAGDAVDESTNEGSPTDASLYTSSYMDLGQRQHSRRSLSPQNQLRTDDSISPNGSLDRHASRRSDTFDTLNSLPRSLQHAIREEPSTDSLRRPTANEFISPAATSQGTQGSQSDSRNVNLFNEPPHEGESLGFRPSGPVNGELGNPHQPSNAYVDDSIRYGATSFSDQPALDLYGTEQSYGSGTLSPDSNPLHELSRRSHQQGAGGVAAQSSWGFETHHTSFSPGSLPGHGRKSSLPTRSAFPSTARAKKLGFFRSRTIRRSRYAPPRNDALENFGRGIPSVMDPVIDAGDTFNAKAQRDGKCSLM